MLPKHPQTGEFLQLINSHQALIHKVCHLYEENPSLRGDLYQEIILNLWKNFGKFNGEAAFSTWMYRVAINTAISIYRKHTLRSPRINSNAALPEIADTPSSIDKEQLEALYKALRELPEIDRAIVMLYLDDCSYRQMEDIIGIKEATLRVRMNRIKEKLRVQLNQPEYEH